MKIGVLSGKIIITGALPLRIITGVGLLQQIIGVGLLKHHLTIHGMGKVSKITLPKIAITPPMIIVITLLMIIATILPMIVIIQILLVIVKQVTIQIHLRVKVAITPAPLMLPTTQTLLKEWKSQQYYLLRCRDYLITPYPSQV